MRRRLAEATKARRTRRTRGEMVLRLFLVLEEAALVFFLTGALLTGVLLAGVPLAGALSGGVDDWDWAAAAGKKPSQSRKKISARTRTAKRRTQTYLLPKVGTHDGKVVFCETSYYFMLKVIAGSCNRVPVTFLVRRTTLLDRFFQTAVEIFVLAAFGDLCLIVEFDLVD